MKEDFFKVGYTSYLSKENTKKTGRTSLFWKKIRKHKFLLSVISIIMISMIINFYLIFKFINILEVSSFLY